MLYIDSMKTEFKNSDFHKFVVKFSFLHSMVRCKTDMWIRTELTEDKSIKRPVFKVELPKALQSKHGVDSVLVCHFANEQMQCWAGASINDEEVFNFLRNL